MIKLIKIHIEEIRGIRKLTLEPNGNNFVVHGPNGSGKSGVVDAIDFGLTGSISRLAGKGTGSLSVKTHGPHVDAKNSPTSSFVRLTLEFPKLGKTATVERRLNQPRKFLVTPDDPDILAVLDKVVQQSELTLSRREIIKYILSEGSTRSQNVQALLKLDALDQLRATFKKASNQLSRDLKNSKASQEAAESDLKDYLGIQTLAEDEMLAAVNIQRKLLGLSELTVFSKDLSFNDGLLLKNKETPIFSKISALGDLDALKAHITSSNRQLWVDKCIAQFDILKNEPAILQQLKRAQFYEQGLKVLDDNDDACPLCDIEWEIEALLIHLKTKIERANVARKIREELLESAAGLKSFVQRLIELIKRARKIAQDVDNAQAVMIINQWIEAVNFLIPKLSTAEGVLEVEEEVRTFRQAPLEQYSNAIDTIFPKSLLSLTTVQR